MSPGSVQPSPSSRVDSGRLAFYYEQFSTEAASGSAPTDHPQSSSHSAHPIAPLPSRCDRTPAPPGIASLPISAKLSSRLSTKVAVHLRSRLLNASDAAQNASSGTGNEEFSRQGLKKSTLEVMEGPSFVFPGFASARPLLGDASAHKKVDYWFDRPEPDFKRFVTILFASSKPLGVSQPGRTLVGPLALRNKGAIWLATWMELTSPNEKQLVWVRIKLRSVKLANLTF